MEFDIHPDVLEELVGYARVIASTRRYPVLVSGLQPANDYDLPDGSRQPGLVTKRYQEIEELRKAIVQSQERIWWLSELADILYYSACLDFVSPSPAQPYWWSVDCFFMAHTYGVEQEEVEAAARAKYRLRASLPYRKGKETPEERLGRDNAENAAIQAALDALPWPGIPLAELAERYTIPLGTLYAAVQGRIIPTRKAGKTVLVNTKDRQWVEWLARYNARRRRERA